MLFTTSNYSIASAIEFVTESGGMLSVLVPVDAAVVEERESFLVSMRVAAVDVILRAALVVVVS